MTTYIKGTKIRVRYQQEREANIKKYWKRINEAKESLGGKCIECNSIENLTFHHKNPELKVNAVTNLAHCLYSIFLEEVKKCVLLCRACHEINHKSAYCIWGHEFTPENTYIRSTGARTCRACQKERMRERRGKKNSG